MNGTVNIARDIWNDSTFKKGEMTQREAWIWLIAQASWKQRIIRIGTREIALERGQLAAATRFLAATWEWSEPKVRRYLDMLANRRMIERATGDGMTVITICNYNKYQNPVRVDDAPATQQPTQDRRTSDANEKKDEIKLLKEEEQDARAREPSPKVFGDWSPDRLHGAVMTAVGLNMGQMPRYWMPPAACIHVWEWHSRLGLTPDQIIEVARNSRQRHPEPPDGPKALDREMQRYAAMLAKEPMTVPSPRTATNHRKGAADARLAFDSAFNAAINAAPEGASLVNRSRSDPFAKQRR